MDVPVLRVVLTQYNVFVLDVLGMPAFYVLQELLD